MDRYPMTREGHEALTQELKQLTTVERPKISKEIGVARDHGDLKENAEYHAAKERQGHIEARIAHIEGMLSRAEVIDTSQLNGARVKFGAWVTLEDVDSGEFKTWRIVGAEEADVNQGRISVTSPVSRALINHEVGDEVKVHAPGGTRTYEITEITWKK
ncbi:MAG TPA: transcription elongation factor GreA [Polyangiales bacterium]|jgi:transcription elongation factor GreA|nr:transcription elongation factor GreA [Polyangiales bacterium]